MSHKNIHVKYHCRSCGTKVKLKVESGGELSRLVDMSFPQCDECVRLSWPGKLARRQHKADTSQVV